MATAGAAASRPASAVRPHASSLPASAAWAAGAVAALVQAAFPEEVECAVAAPSREEFAAAEQARADCSAGLRVGGSV